MLYVDLGSHVCVYLCLDVVSVSPRQDLDVEWVDVRYLGVSMIDPLLFKSAFVIRSTACCVNTCMFGDNSVCTESVFQKCSGCTSVRTRLQ